jgi:hypothetical protein
MSVYSVYVPMRMPASWKHFLHVFTAGRLSECKMRIKDLLRLYSAVYMSVYSVYVIVRMSASWKHFLRVHYAVMSVLCQCIVYMSVYSVCHHANVIFMKIVFC